MYPNWKQAEAHYDEAMGKGKGFLAQNYDPVTNRRRNVFPFTQTINAAHVKDEDKIRT
jgi:hypothetical protein